MLLFVNPILKIYPKEIITVEDKNIYLSICWSIFHRLDTSEGPMVGT
jgi:hypothetical protein